MSGQPKPALSIGSGFKLAAIPLFLSFTLAACGGGSSDDSNTETPVANNPPTADAGADVSADENTEVTLNGTGTDSDGTVESYSWSQTSGPDAALEDTSSADITFTAPEVDADKELVFELTVTDDDGATETDTTTVTVVNVEEQNQAPIANAGDDQSAEAGTEVVLDGSSSSDPDGEITSYQWQQVNTGAQSVTINNATSAEASVLIPSLADDTEFEIQLTVSDDKGATAHDSVIINGRPEASVHIGDVRGNTASEGAVAEFTVALASRPTSTVTIPVYSSDTSEGETEQSELVFTPENWYQRQTVIVRGTNANVENGTQDYKVVLEQAVSSDSLYNSIDPNDVLMKGIDLSLAPPEDIQTLVVGTEFTFQPELDYTGTGQLSYSLVSAPEGMTIDLSSGAIKWQPNASQEGEAFGVEVAVNDGSLFASVSFELAVAEPTQLNTELDGNVLTVVDDTSNLNGLSFTQMSSSSAEAIGASSTAQSLSEVELFKLTSDQVAATTGVTPISDVFMVKADLNNAITLRFPLSDLPAGVSIGDIKLYAHVEANDVDGKIWSPVAIKRRFEGDSAEPILVIELGGLSGVAFIGYETQSASTNGVSNNAPYTGTNATLSASDIECEQVTFEGEMLDEHVCTSTVNSDLEITIEGFGDGDTRWGGATKEELVSWLVDAQPKFDEFGIGYNNIFTVNIHQMSDPRILGYVTTANFENRNTLHINSRNSISSEVIRSTAVHEYFHHAQGHSDTAISGQDLLIDSYPDSSWFIEGSARWFEDEVYDEANSYNAKENGYGARIAEAGINAGSANTWLRRPYQRFTFMKLLSNKCSDFNNSFQSALNIDSSTDPSGIQNVVSSFEDWQCNFGDHLGAENQSTLAAALTYYNYVTQLKRDMSLLDSNEPSNYDFSVPPYRFAQPWYGTVSQWLDADGTNERNLIMSSQVPAVGAYSFKVPAVSGNVPEDKVAELRFSSSSELIVSVSSSDPNFVSDSDLEDSKHQWFSTSDNSSYIYDAAQSVPELFVTVVNPNLESSANLNVSFAIRDELNVDTIIDSHIEGSEVSNRVVTISGNIPEEARDIANKVTVTANGIETDVSLNSNGTYAADVVVSLGSNIIKAQGFDGATPVTNEEVITIEGVESSGTGLNALIASRVVFVLRWDTDNSDIDIYSTDKNAGTIWYSDKTEGPGNLDYDNTRGYGPEVVSYRATGDDVYVNGQFNVDVHYYSGSPVTNYSLDVVLNETNGTNRRLLKFDSIEALTESSSGEAGPDNEGLSRFNDLLEITCSNQRVCSLGAFDSSKLEKAGSSSSNSNSQMRVIHTKQVAPNAYEQCMSALRSTIEKSGSAQWTCAKNGSKNWH